MSHQPSSGVNLSWPVFVVLLLAIGGIVFFGTGYLVDSRTDEIIDKAVSKSAEEMVERSDEMAEKVVEQIVDRSSEVADEVVDKTIEQATEKAKDKVKNVSIGDIFGTLEEIKNETLKTGHDIGYELAPISLEDEWEIGNDVAQSLRSQYRIIDDAEQNERIRRLAQPVLDMLSRTRGLPYTFTVIQQEEVNAFAILGGHVFIASGLIDRMQTDAAIQSVIAHEIAHVEYEHCVRGTWAGLKAQGVLGSNAASAILVGSYKVLVEHGFSEDQELECDEFAYRALYKLGIPKQDSLRFVSVLWELESERHGSSSSSSSESNQVLDVLNRHYRTHPDAQERYNRLMSIRDDPDWRP